MSAVDVVLAPRFIRFDVMVSVGADDILATFPKLQALSNKLLTNHAVLQVVTGDWREKFIEIQQKRGGILLQNA